MTRLEYVFPDGPQKDRLVKVVDRLVENSEVMEIWLGGSFATGQADRYSDVDLRVSVETANFGKWVDADLTEIFDDHCPGRMTMVDGERSVLHHTVLSDGEIYDFYIQPFPPSFVEDQILPIATRHPEFQASPVNQPIEVPFVGRDVSAPDLEQALRSFWINTHKHRKVLHRGLDLMVHIGLQFEKDFLRRIWTIQITGRDEPRNKTIHSLTSQTRSITEGIGSHAFKILGMPLQSREQLVLAIEAVRNEISVVGHALAEHYGFTYPSELESVVLSGWADWQSTCLSDN